MNKQFLRFIFFLLMCFTLPLTATAQVVDIPDSNLRAAVETALGKAPGATITTADMATLTRLDANEAGISDLTGLEHVINLTDLHLWRNSVSDLSPLAGLTNLTGLYLGINSASDLSPLTRLTNLESLFLDRNGISDLSPLAGLTNLTRLALGNNTISDISVLAGLTNLTWLRLGGNSISDISPVKGLTNLTWLHLQSNRISDISPTASLTNLIELNLSGNSISSIAAVAGLTNLTWLYLQSNSISAIAPLASLTNLTALRLDRNSISDISALSSLTQLKELRLDRNNITDLLSLVANARLGTGDTVDVRSNPLNYTSIRTHISTLQSRGVTVEFDNRTPTTLLNISGVITELDNLLIVEVRDGNGLPFAGVPVTFTITSGGGTLSTTRTTTDENGRAESRFTLDSVEGTNTVRASVEGISKSVTFSNVAADIPDPNLRAAIEDALGKTPGTPIAPVEMAALTRLKAQNANISDLTGLEHATNLKSLWLGGENVQGTWRNSNSISDLSPLSGLIHLEELDLWRNLVSDLSPVLSLTNLKTLRLGYNEISNLSPLVANAGLGEGDTIYVRGNPLNYPSIKTIFQPSKAEELRSNLTIEPL